MHVLFVIRDAAQFQIVVAGFPERYPRHRGGPVLGCEDAEPRLQIVRPRFRQPEAGEDFLPLAQRLVHTPPPILRHVAPVPAEVPRKQPLQCLVRFYFDQGRNAAMIPGHPRAEHFTDGELEGRPGQTPNAVFIQHPSLHSRQGDRAGPGEGAAVRHPPFSD